MDETTLSGVTSCLCCISTLASMPEEVFVSVIRYLNNCDLQTLPAGVKDFKRLTHMYIEY